MAKTSDRQGMAVREPAADGSVKGEAAKAKVEQEREPAGGDEATLARRGERPTASDFQIVNYYFDLACEKLGLPDHVREVMRTAYREISVQVPVRMTDGSTKVYSGFRVQHNGARGPYKGGVRYHPEVDIDEVRALAMLMTLEDGAREHSLRRGEGRYQLPGRPARPEGGAGDLALVHGQGRKVLGPNRDIMAPDLNTNAQTMAWMMDEYGKLHGHTPAIVTGKPIELEGSYGREAAVGRGLSYLYREAAPQLGISPPESTCVVQGFGNVGYWSASILHQLGAKVVGVSDVHGAIRSDSGIEPADLRKFLQEGGKLPEFPGAEPIDPDDLLAIECDVFVPAALGGMIREDNVDRIGCKVLLEGANSPTTPAADDVLEEKGVYVIPDVLANAGGVVVSYFEWVQNMQHFRWDEREINDKLGSIMRHAFREVTSIAKQRKIPLRIAAWELGIERVVEAARTRGYI